MHEGTEPCAPARTLVRASTGCAAEQGAVGREQGHGRRLGAETPSAEQHASLFTSPQLHTLDRARLQIWATSCIQHVSSWR